MTAATEGKRADGQIVTFYSYKGGSGRTMALANVAWILAANGYRVLVVDWDLEAPGLPEVLPAVPRRQPSWRGTPGVLNLIRRFAFESARVHGDADRLSDDEAWYDAFAELDGHTVPDRVGLRRRARSTCSPPACRTATTPASPASTGASSTSSSTAAAFFEALRDRMKSAYDYVLIDSRTGLSDVGRHLHGGRCPTPSSTASR